MKILPKADRVLLEIDKAPQSFAGGELIIARVPELNKGTVYKHKPQRGRVLAVGPGVKSLEVEDYVICTPFNGVSLPRQFCEQGQDLKLIKEEFVLLVLGQPDAMSFGHTLEEWPGDRAGFENWEENYRSLEEA